VFDTKDRRMLMTSRMLTTYQTMSMAEQCIQGHFDYKRYKIVPLSGVVTIEE
jgi:hypothetical protein